jgi:TPR repeat protein
MESKKYEYLKTAKSEYKLGVRYLYGIGVPINLEKALIYIKCSAYQGFVYA